ncbi:MAG: UDP-3-O-(3-hydroxymyristoyl)glucosamine N-acyltransferase [Phycisphaerae bacterium]|nr:UDP-3-O-(3-hydroxymyristoyl)glucosamine N-acyltransferase [Phycisphaerae bacterium]
MQGKTLGELASHVGGRIHGNADLIIVSAGTLDKAGPSDITFFSNRKYESQLKTTTAGAVILAAQADTPASQLIVEDPYYAFMQIVVLLHGHREHKKIGVSPSASIAPSAVLGADCHIHPFVTLSDGVRVGDRCIFYPGVFIGPGVQIGDDCIFYANAVVYDDCRIGNRVILQANATVGEDGFGFSTHKGIHHKIPQVGRVVLEDDVEIGAGCGIERGTLDDTVIAKGTKVGDMVTIGHGTKVGPHCLLVPQVGVAGSVTLGHHCVLGGQVGVVGHIKIGNLVNIGAQAGVIGNVPDGSIIVGSPAIDANKARRAYALIADLPEMRKTIRLLQRQIGELEGKEDLNK